MIALSGQKSARWPWATLVAVLAVASLGLTDARPPRRAAEDAEPAKPLPRRDRGADDAVRSERAAPEAPADAEGEAAPPPTTTEEQPADADEAVVRVYDIRELITPVQNYEADWEVLTGPRKDDGTKAVDKEQPPAPTQAELAERVVALVRETINPEGWGKDSHIRELNGNLVVTAPPPTQRQVKQLLDQLREVRGIQVLVDVRFLAVDDDTLARLRERLDEAPREDRIDHDEAALAPAVSAFLDKEQVDALVGQAKEGEGSRVVASPRLILFNGQTAYVAVGNQRAYVADYEVLAEEGGQTRYEPVAGVVEAGVLLQVGATVTSDRRYVVLSLYPKLAQLQELEEVPYENAPAERGLTVQVPKLLISELRTTLAIPEGRTLLLAGLRGVVTPGGEVFVGEGADDKDDQPKNVLLLVKPKLILATPVEEGGGKPE